MEPAGTEPGEHLDVGTDRRLATTEWLQAGSPAREMAGTSVRRRLDLVRRLSARARGPAVACGEVSRQRGDSYSEKPGLQQLDRQPAGCDNVQLFHVFEFVLPWRSCSHGRLTLRALLVALGGAAGGYVRRSKGYRRGLQLKYLRNKTGMERYQTEIDCYQNSGSDCCKVFGFWDLQPAGPPR